jgi:hypothetical protein
MIMSSHKDTTHLPPPLDLSGWRKLPAVLMVVGGILSVIGADRASGGIRFFWLMAFMFYLSIALGALVSRDRASFDRRRLVGSHPPFLRTSRVAAVSVAGDFIFARHFPSRRKFITWLTLPRPMN